MTSQNGWTLTYYCSACNDPKGSTKGCFDNQLDDGDCAISRQYFIKNRNITINESTYCVADKTSSNKKKTVDVWLGKQAKCECGKYGKKSNLTITF